MENACMHDTGEFLMKIIKIVNNNIVTSLDEQNREIIVMGRGLGFGRKPGMTIDDGKVEKVFRLNSAGENQKLVDIIQDIPLEHIKAADQIIEYAKSMLGEKLKETIYLSLIDHIDGAIERYENQIQFANPLLWEIKQYYPSEFKVGVQRLNILKKMLGIELPVDEAAVIDGAGPISLFFKIIMPLLKPTMVTCFILQFMGVWSDFLTPLYLSSKSKMFPMTMAVYQFFGKNKSYWNYIFADIVLTCIPVVIVYMIGQKYIVGGMTSGAVKE